MALAFIVLMVLVPSAQRVNSRPIEPISAEIAARRVSQCGLGPVLVRHDDERVGPLGFLVVTDAASATDDKLACAEKATGDYEIKLPAPLQPRFAAIRHARWSAASLAYARSWLSARGLLSRVPRYQAGTTNDTTNDGAFTRAIEPICGRHAKGAFQSSFGFHAISPEWMTRSLRAGRGYLIDCLMNVAVAAGYEVGFPNSPDAPWPLPTAAQAARPPTDRP